VSLEPIPTANDFTRCFGCGPDNPHGPQLRFLLDPAARRVEATWVAAERFAGYESMLHGGAIAVLLDEAMGWALWGVERRVGVTRDLHVSFQRPVIVGKEYRIVGWVEAVRADGATVCAQVRTARDRVAAEATAEFAFVAAERVRDRERDRP
jgi:acyl-coenzyme A thioesterase PaaI-like protein